MMRVARILKGKRVHPDVSLVDWPRQPSGIDDAGAKRRFGGHDGGGCADSGSCVRPVHRHGTELHATGAVSLRTNNRNFYARSGTASAGIYLVSCEMAAISALTGVLTDPRTLDVDLEIPQPEHFEHNDNLVIPPVEPGHEAEVEVVRGPNIHPFPLGKALTETVSGKVLLKMEDNITTDHIMPSNAKLLPYRSNIPYLSD